MARKLRNELTWSVSRDRLFQSCERAYYYHYYGSWGGWEADTSAATRKLYILKNICTMEMWAGSIVHETIAESLERYARRSTPIRTADLQARARQKLRRGWKEAVNRDWQHSPKKTNLHGLYYGNGRTLPRHRTERVRDRVYGCLQAFADAEILREIQATPYLNWKPVDKLDWFLVDGLKVWCAVDFAFVDPAGNLRILDWKTGREDAEALKTQLACYAFFAGEKWFTKPEEIRVSGVFLRENARVAEYDLSPDAMIDARDRILTSAATMREKLSDVARNEAAEDDFAFCENERTCVRCNFREVCPRIPGDGRNGQQT